MKQRLIDKVLSEKRVQTNRFIYKLVGERIVKRPIEGGEWRTAHILKR